MPIKNIIIVIDIDPIDIQCIRIIGWYALPTWYRRNVVVNCKLYKSFVQISAMTKEKNLYFNKSNSVLWCACKKTNTLTQSRFQVKLNNVLYYSRCANVRCDYFVEFVWIQSENLLPQLMYDKYTCKWHPHCESIVDAPNDFFD